MTDSIIDRIKLWKETEEYREKIREEADIKKDYKTFLKQFSLEAINKMTKEEYATGRENRKSFCYLVEKRFETYGSIGGRTTAWQKFVFYWSKDKNAYVFGSSKVKNRKGFGNSIDEIFANVKNALCDLIDATYKDDLTRIKENPLNPQFKNKISYLYDSQNQIPIYSNDDLDMILTLLDIKFDKNEDRVFKRKKLFNYYKNANLEDLLNTNLFMHFIYSKYGYLSYLRGNDKPTISKNKSNKIKLVDISISSIIKENKESLNKKSIRYNSESEEKRRIIGRRAEDIVAEYLNKHRKELHIVNIKSYCFGDEQDDGKGYDFECVRVDGSSFFVEVKGTIRNLKDKIEFEMSINEYKVMKNNSDSYYIFFVDNVNEGSKIKRILAKELYGEEPTRYKFCFECQEKN